MSSNRKRRSDRRLDTNSAALAQRIPDAVVKQSWLTLEKTPSQDNAVARILPDGLDDLRHVIFERTHDMGRNGSHDRIVAASGLAGNIPASHA